MIYINSQKMKLNGRVKLIKKHSHKRCYKNVIKSIYINKNTGSFLFINLINNRRYWRDTLSYLGIATARGLTLAKR